VNTIERNGLLFVLLSFFIQHGWLCARFRPTESPKVTCVFDKLPTLETERLILREVCQDDVHDLYELYADPDVFSFIPVNGDETIEDTQKRVERICSQMRQGVWAFWAIVLKEENKVIGVCGLYDFSFTSASAEVFSLMAKRYWSQGFMTEAKRVIIKCGFECMGLNRIDASVFPENGASIRVNQKLGFQIIGTIPEYIYAKGGYWDRLIMSLLKKDFLCEACIENN
jgi:ribosomal-protein-alanine N-acetyltransferase